MNVLAMTRPKHDVGTFDEWWTAYPHVARREKALARMKWEAITGDGLHTKMADRDAGGFAQIFLKASAAELLAGVKAYDEAMRKPGCRWEYKDDGKFICGPAVFLNRGRWMDYV